MSFIDHGPNQSDSIFLNFFSSITTRPIEAKFHVEPPWDGGMKAYSNGPGHMTKMVTIPIYIRSIRVAERLALPTLDHGVAGSNPAGGEILPKPKWCFIAQSLSCSPFHRLEMTEILLKGRKTLTHPSIHSYIW